MLTGHFLESLKGQIFLTQHGDFKNNKVILCLPSITEEMNLSRAVIAKQAQYFASQGITTFILDYYGTGDSEGELNNVSSQDWCQDIIIAGQWLINQGATSISLWGIRFGSLLAMHFYDELIAQLPLTSQLHWKPVINGKLFISQLLRIKQINNMMQSSQKINWRKEIFKGEEIEVAGYPLNEEFVSSIEKLTINNFNPKCYLEWHELGCNAISPAVSKITSSWPETLFSLQYSNTPQFWQVPEVFNLPELNSKHKKFIGSIG